jgi:hypothetical protein
MARIIPSPQRDVASGSIMTERLIDGAVQQQKTLCLRVRNPLLRVVEMDLGPVSGCRRAT